MRSFFLVFFIGFSFCQAQTVGLFQNDTASYNGYTLFAPAAFYDTYLIDNCGKEINTWTSTYLPGLSAYILPDGDLLRTGRVNSSFFSGGGSGGILERYDWDGNLEWSYQMSDSLIHQHHDIEPLPNGNILVLTWERFLRNQALAAGRDTSRIQNEIWLTAIFEIQPIGSTGANIVWEWHAMDHLIQENTPLAANFGIVSDHPEKINFNYYHPQMGGIVNPDFMHSNGIDYNPEKDQILISSRNFSELWIIDHSTSTQEAAGSSGGKYGKGGDLLYRFGNPAAYNRGTTNDQVFFAQHDGKWIQNGYPGFPGITLFNNTPTQTSSAVLSFTPPEDSAGYYTSPGNQAYGPATADWSFQSTDIFSANVSGAQRLPNGNTLVCSGRGGKFFEYDLQKNLVWAYRSPVDFNGPVNQGSTPLQATVFRAERYGEGYSAFAGRNLSPGSPIENNPDNYTCTTYPNIGLDEDEKIEIRFLNPIQDFWQIEFSKPLTGNWVLYDLSGKIIDQGRFEKNMQIARQVFNGQAGIYFLHIDSPKLTSTIKLLKF